MKSIAFAALIVAASPALVHAQAATQTPAPATARPAASSDITRSLNGAPAQTVTAAPRAEGAPPPPPIVTPAPAAASNAVRPPAATPSSAAVPPAAPATAEASAPAPAPAATVLDAAAIAALPFTIELPPGFRIETGRPGPNFKIYTVKRGDKSFAMIYAGPSSQFPIYSGEMAEVGGRATVVANQGGTRHAMEHLFQRETAPKEIHVWIMSLEGADQALAERIAQTVDVR
ncbi:hypothetical protein [Brevundimonas sp.]|uniref:hypothetical protein n=1 Tax=Brevundimonas sp. TaxID=1871086 RepID=UPI0035B0DF35